MDVDRLEISSQPHALVELVPTLESDRGSHTLPANYLDRVCVDVIHDGHWLPEEFLLDKDGAPITPHQIDADYVRERDWGASAVAARLSAQLGLTHYARVNVARVLMDFGRFPGSTPKYADHLHRYAINYPFSNLLSYRQKKHLLQAYYDGVSEALENTLRGKLIKIAIHTYDRYNSSGTERPAVSLMTRALAYQNTSEMPAGLFDPLYPDILAEFTADRVLRDRISLTLEKQQIPVAHNYPYCLPEGSLEVRYQVWAYFNALRYHFERAFPESRSNPSFDMVWEMLSDTNLRSSDSDSLRSFIHMYRRAPAGREVLFERAASAYGKLAKFCRGRGDEMLEHYRFNPMRTSSIAIEVRKDLACEFDEHLRPIGIRTDYVNFISDAIARAISIYFNDDRRDEENIPEELERHTPWYARPG